MILVGGQLEVIVSERVITAHPAETKEQEKAREKAGLPPPSFQYTAARSRPVVDVEAMKAAKGW